MAVKASWNLNHVALAAAIGLLIGFFGGMSGMTGPAGHDQLLDRPAMMNQRNRSQYRPSSEFLAPIKTRIDLGELLEKERFEVAVELGVQRGLFAAELLKRWPSCKKYYLIDLWAPQDNYKVRTMSEA